MSISGKVCWWKYLTLTQLKKISYSRLLWFPQSRKMSFHDMYVKDFFFFNIDGDCFQSVVVSGMMVSFTVLSHSSVSMGALPLFWYLPFLSSKTWNFHHRDFHFLGENYQKIFYTFWGYSWRFFFLIFVNPIVICLQEGHQF